MQVDQYLGLVYSGEQQLAEAFLSVAERHQRDYEIKAMCKQFAEWCNGHMQALEPFFERYGHEKASGPQVLRSSLFHGVRMGSLGLLHDMQDLSLLASSVRTDWTVLSQAGKALRDTQLSEAADRLGDETDRQLTWLCGRVKATAPEALTVPPNPASTAKASAPKEPTASNVPEPVWAPLAAGMLVLIVGLLGILLGRAWLFPSLGPTAYLAGEHPAHPTTRFYNIFAGHIIGLVAGFLAVFAFGAMNDPVVLVDHQLTYARLGAAVLALVLSMAAAWALRASHPPAGATTLLVALGSIKTVQDALNLAIAALLIAVLAEGVRRVRLGSFTRAMAPERIPTDAGR